MKRKLIMVVLSVALTLALIPTLAAYADELDLGDTPAITDQAQEDVQGDEDVPESDIEDEDAIVDEGAIAEGETAEIELPKINLKSPVTQITESEIGTRSAQFALVARVGSETIAPDRVTWTSDDETVATISAGGIVTVIGVGKARFTAVMMDGTARNGYAKVFVFADNNKPIVNNHSNTNADPVSITLEEKTGKHTHK